MAAPTKILVPLDLSERSLQGLDYAVSFARGFDAELVLFCNVNLPERAALEDFGAGEGLLADEAGHILLERDGHDRADDLTMTTVLAHEDSPAQGILEAADEHGADLIVMASHGRTGMTRLLLGSVAETIARTAHVPVVVVPTRTIAKTGAAQ